MRTWGSSSRSRLRQWRDAGARGLGYERIQPPTTSAASEKRLISEDPGVILRESQRVDGTHVPLNISFLVWLGVLTVGLAVLVPAFFIATNAIADDVAALSARNPPPCAHATPALEPLLMLFDRPRDRPVPRYRRSAVWPPPRAR